MTKRELLDQILHIVNSWKDLEQENYIQVYDKTLGYSIHYLSGKMDAYKDVIILIHKLKEIK